MIRKVNNVESAMLFMVVLSDRSTSADYVDATFDFLKSLPAFANDQHAFEFMNIHLMDVHDFDDTHPDDIPAHYTLNY